MEFGLTLLEDLLYAGKSGQTLAERVGEQDAKIETTNCTRPRIGRLIAAHYTPLLFLILSLDDEQFNAEYPGEKRLTLKDRQALAAAIRQHCKDCPRCGLKFSTDMEWDEHVDRVLKKQPQLI